MVSNIICIDTFEEDDISGCFHEDAVLPQPTTTVLTYTSPVNPETGANVANDYPPQPQPTTTVDTTTTTTVPVVTVPTDWEPLATTGVDVGVVAFGASAALVVGIIMAKIPRRD